MQQNETSTEHQKLKIQRQLNVECTNTNKSTTTQLQHFRLRERHQKQGTESVKPEDVQVHCEMIRSCLLEKKNRKAMPQ